MNFVFFDLIGVRSIEKIDLPPIIVPHSERDSIGVVRKEDEKLLIDINSILKQWEQDGTLHEILKKWLPEEYLKRMNQ